MSLDSLIIAKIARLAYIEVVQDEQEQLVRELTSILEFIHKLNEVDTEDVKPMVSVVEMTLPHREDVITERNDSQDVLRNAPVQVKNYFVVPKIVDS